MDTDGKNVHTSQAGLLTAALNNPRILIFHLGTGEKSSK